MSAPAPRAGSTVDRTLGELRRRVLDGELEPGARLIERELIEHHGVARHTLRAALRTLAGEGLIELVPNAGARVAALGREQAEGLFELRAALEVESCRLANARDRNGLLAAVGAAAAGLRAECAAGSGGWSEVTEAHAAVHRAIVGSAGSDRLAAAYDAIEGEMRLFVGALRPTWSLEGMVAHHEQLARDLEGDWEPALRAHLADGLASVLGASR